MTWLARLVRTLRTRKPDTQLILILDAATIHLSGTFRRRALSLGVRLVFIPAGLTWLLQPLDTHVFAALKRDIRTRLTRSILSSSALASGGSSAGSASPFIVAHRPAQYRVSVQGL